MSRSIHISVTALKKKKDLDCHSHFAGGAQNTCHPPSCCNCSFICGKESIPQLTWLNHWLKNSKVQRDHPWTPQENSKQWHSKRTVWPSTKTDTRPHTHSDFVVTWPSKIKDELFHSCYVTSSPSMNDWTESQNRSRNPDCLTDREKLSDFRTFSTGM